MKYLEDVKNLNEYFSLWQIQKNANRMTNYSLSLNIFILTCTRKLRSVASLQHCSCLPVVSAKGKSGRRNLIFWLSYVDSKLIKPFENTPSLCMQGIKWHLSYLAQIFARHFSFICIRCMNVTNLIVPCRLQGRQGCRAGDLEFSASHWVQYSTWWQMMHIHEY